jgi:hypothetical protein
MSSIEESCIVISFSKVLTQDRRTRDTVKPVSLTNRNQLAKTQGM